MDRTELLTKARQAAQVAREEILPAIGNPSFFVLNGMEYAAAISLSGIRPDLQSGGHAREQTLTARVRKSVLPDQPGLQDTLTCAGYNFMVDPSQEQKDSGDLWIIRARRTL